MSEIQFTQRTIAPAGRNKYGNYLSKGNVTKSVVTTTYAGNDTTTTIGNTGTTEDSGLTDFYCVLSQTNATFNATDLPQGATAATQVIVYKGFNKGVGYICDIDAVSATTANEAITNLEAPPFMGIKGMPASGLNVTFQDNGTSAATIIFTADNDLSGSTGTLKIPVCVYKRNDNLPNPDDLYSWFDHQYRVTSANTLEYIGDCEVVWLEYAWNVNRAAASLYNMDLSNQTAAVNVLSADTPSGDILAPNSIAALECTASTYLNGELLTGVTYSIFTQPRYNARGVSITNSANTGVLNFTSAGTNSFNFTGPTLPIDITATYSGRTVAVKTMTITKNYPGGDGTPAHTRYIVTDYDVVKYNPNTSAFTPNQVVGRVMLQVGDQLPVYDSATTIYLWYDDLDPATASTSAVGEITANTYDGISSISFGLKNADNVFYEIEEVPVVSEGVDGQDGQPGQPGASGASGESAWYLTLSNDNASINCDSNGSIYAGAVRPTCVCKLYYGSTRQTSGVLYDVNFGGATGVRGIAGIDGTGTYTLHFNTSSESPAFSFNGTSAEITVSASTKDPGSSVYTLRDVKVMTVTKSYDGADGQDGTDGTDGTDAVSYWLTPSFGEIIYDPNNSTMSPSAITCSAYKQIGQGAVIPAADTTIYYSWQSRSTGSFTSESAYTGSITIRERDCVAYRRLRFTLKVGTTQVDQEDVDIMTDGLDGEGGQGRTGAAIRGPYDWAQNSATTRCWCAGSSSLTCDDCDKWIDVIYKDGTYYYCNTTYYGRLSPWNSVSGYWTSGDSFDFVAANLILASGASINFITGNELYLRDANNNITGGAAGGSGITFWAGAQAPGDAPFKVDSSGNMSATTGVIGGWKYNSGGLDWAYYDGVENLYDASLGEDGVSFAYRGAGMQQSLNAGLDGIHFSTERIGVTGLSMEGDDMKVILSDGLNSIAQSDLQTGINTNMDITGHKNLGVEELANGLSVTTPVYAGENIYTQVKFNSTGTVTGYNTAVSSPFTGLKIAVITTGSTYSNYFTKSGGHWIFNGDLDTNIDSYDYGYMVQVTSSAVVSNWRGMGYPGIPSEWVGMWCACGSNGSSTSYFYRPTGIYGPNHSKKGDTIYFSV